MSQKQVACLINLCLLFGGTSQVWGETALMLKPKEVKLGAPLVDETFSEAKLGKAWAVAKGEWMIQDGAVVGKEIESDKHAAVLSLNQPNRNSVLQFSFKLDGAKTFNLSLNHAKGHLFRVAISPEAVTITKDKDKKDPDSRALVLGEAKTKLEQGKWYTALVEINGDQVVVQTDNGVMIQGNAPGLDVDKTGYRFVVGGQSVYIRGLKSWEVAQ